ncbi:MAG: hypothetical protein BalsKO_17900 [Balneolaceae bacterium]
MNILFTITNVETTFNQGNNNFPYCPFVFAVNGSNNFEWGAFCQAKEVPVANFPILKYGENYPNISYLMISTQKGQYQLFWNQGTNPGDAIILLQELTTSTPYPRNQTPLWSGSSAEALSFTLNIDQTVTSGSGITLVQNS